MSHVTPTEGSTPSLFISSLPGFLESKNLCTYHDSDQRKRDGDEMAKLAEWNENAAVAQNDNFT